MFAYLNVYNKMTHPASWNCVWWQVVTWEQLISSRAFLRPLEELALFPLFQRTNVKTSPVIGPQFEDGSHQGAFTVMTRGEVQIRPLPRHRTRSLINKKRIKLNKYFRVDLSHKGKVKRQKEKQTIRALFTVYLLFKMFVCCTLCPFLF